MPKRNVYLQERQGQFEVQNFLLRVRPLNKMWVFSIITSKSHLSLKAPLLIAKKRRNFTRPTIVLLGFKLYIKSKNILSLPVILSKNLFKTLKPKTRRTHKRNTKYSPLARQSLIFRNFEYPWRNWQDYDGMVRTRLTTNQGIKNSIFRETFEQREIVKRPFPRPKTTFSRRLGNYNTYTDQMEYLSKNRRFSKTIWVWIRYENRWRRRFTKTIWRRIPTKRKDPGEWRAKTLWNLNEKHYLKKMHRLKQLAKYYRRKKHRHYAWNRKYSHWYLKTHRLQAYHNKWPRYDEYFYNRRFRYFSEEGKLQRTIKRFFPSFKSTPLKRSKILLKWIQINKKKHVDHQVHLNRDRRLHLTEPVRPRKKVNIKLLRGKKRKEELQRRRMERYLEKRWNLPRFRNLDIMNRRHFFSISREKLVLDPILRRAAENGRYSYIQKFLQGIDTSNYLDYRLRNLKKVQNPTLCAFRRVFKKIINPHQTKIADIIFQPEPSPGEQHEARLDRYKMRYLLRKRKQARFAGKRFRKKRMKNYLKTSMISKRPDIKNKKRAKKLQKKGPYTKNQRQAKNLQNKASRFTYFPSLTRL